MILSAKQHRVYFPDRFTHLRYLWRNYLTSPVVVVIGGGGVSSWFVLLLMSSTGTSGLPGWESRATRRARRLSKALSVQRGSCSGGEQNEREKGRTTHRGERGDRSAHRLAFFSQQASLVSPPAVGCPPSTRPVSLPVLSAHPSPTLPR